LNGNTIVKEDGLAEWSSPYLNVMLSHQINDRVKVFINLNGAKAGNIDVRNYWGEYSFSNLVNVRLGKIYRKFGLYNEILDAVPTYYGIEPPELFDTDHLIVSRTTTVMMFGGLDVGPGTASYSISSDNGESGSPAKATPLGYDLNYKFGNGDYTIGVSGYTTNGNTASDIGLGDGSPKSGVLPWMASDKFSIFGGYAETKFGSLLLQAEYWKAPHAINRDPAMVLEVVANAGINDAQRARFLVNPSGETVEANVRIEDKFDVETCYLRAGYSIESSVGEWGPYLQWDWYKNVETIGKKTYGGDDEAGVSDDGQFNKYTAGLVYRPVPEMALKLDGSIHRYLLNTETVQYTEIRFDVSFIFGR
jgi:hypothetical protein